MQRDLNDAWLRALPPPATGRLEVWDTRVVGLVLRLTPKGGASWSVRLRTRDGKRTRPKLGTWPAVGIAEARKRALASISAIQGGADPVAERKATRAAQTARRDDPAVTERLTEWQGAVHPRPWSERYAAEVKRVCDQAVVPALGVKPLRDTTREDWTKLLRKRQANGAGAAAFLYRTVSSFLGFAEAHGWIPLPLLPRKGAAAIAPPVAARARVLTDAELVEVWHAAEPEPPQLRAFVRLLILTAARKEEVAGIATGEVDRDAGRWALPGARTKNKLPITLPLDRLARAELAAVWPNEGARRLLGRGGGAFQGSGRLKLRMDARIAATHAEAGQPRMPAWRWHDLRRTARTGMTRLGVPRDHAEAAINHVSGRSALERTYDRHDYAEEVLAALGTWQRHVAGVVGRAA